MSSGVGHFDRFAKHIRFGWNIIVNETANSYTSVYQA